MTGRIESEATASTVSYRIKHKGRQPRTSKKSDKFLRELRPEEDSGTQQNSPPNRLTSKQRRRKPYVKSRPRKRAQERRKSLARASTNSVSSVDSEAESSRAKARLAVNLDVVNQLAATVLSEKHEEKPVSSDKLRQQLASISQPEANPYSPQKRMQRKRTPSRQKPKRKATVFVKDFQFIPRNSTVLLGGTVTFNVSREATASFALDGVGDDLIRLEAGQSYTHTFKQPGEVRFTCTLQTSMVGRINVVAAESSPKRGLEVSLPKQLLTDAAVPIASTAEEGLICPDTSSKQGVVSLESKPKRKRPKRKRGRRKRNSAKNVGTDIISVKSSKDVASNVKEQQARGEGPLRDGFDASSASRFLRSRWRNAIVVL